jgi:predicted DNA-binding protein (MmcQ/YjbR family)
MDAEIIRQYCLQKHKACETYPFGDVPICYKLNNRIFAQLYPHADDFKITLKCTASMGDFYRQLYPGIIVRGYHCPPIQQPYWNTIYLEDFPEEELLNLIDLAYDTVLHSFSKKVQAEILSDMCE